MSRRLWYVLLNGLVGAWLLAAGLIAVLPGVPREGTWLVVHLLLLGAVSTAIFIWSQHFADTLLRRQAAGGRVGLGARILTHTAGALAVVAGIVAGSWPVVVAGGILVALAAVAHAASLAVQLHGALPARFAPLVRYYIAAAACLVVGVTLGVIMARPEVTGTVHARLFLAHIGLNVLGWVGLTVVGTVVLLWPTVLRTKAPETTDAAAKRALPLLIAGVVLVGVGSLLDLRIVVVVALLLYLAGLAQVIVESVRVARRSPPVSFAAWSIGAALGWFASAWLPSACPSRWRRTGRRRATAWPAWCPCSRLDSPRRFCLARSATSCRWCWEAARRLRAPRRASWIGRGCSG